MRPSAVIGRVGLTLTLSMAVPAAAQPEDPAHEELGTTRTALLDAITSADIERVMPMRDENVVIIWQNGE